MPRNPEGKQGRAWLQWGIALSYGNAMKDLKPKRQKQVLKEFYEFCTPQEPQRGRFGTFVFRWIIPETAKLPMPSAEQVDRFRQQAKELVERRLNGETQVRIGTGASVNYQADLVTFESRDPVYTAVSQFGAFMSANWNYVRRCPRAHYPKEKCHRVFVLKKLPIGKEEPYCSRRCRQRMQKREEDQIAEERYGARGRKPKEGA
jgi:hypothetical protein